MNDQMVLQAINDLSERIEKRFDKVDDKFEKLDERIQKAETDILRVKTISAVASGALAFVGWDHFKPWLISLMK